MTTVEEGCLYLRLFQILIFIINPGLSELSRTLSWIPGLIPGLILNYGNYYGFRQCKMDNDLRNCPSLSSRPICTSSDAPRCHHVPTNTFFLFFFNPKNTVQLSFIPIFQAILPLPPFLCFFSHFLPFYSVSVLPSFITQKKESEMDWHRIL